MKLFKLSPLYSPTTCPFYSSLPVSTKQLKSKSEDHPMVSSSTLQHQISHQDLFYSNPYIPLGFAPLIHCTVHLDYCNIFLTALSVFCLLVLQNTCHHTAVQETFLNTNSEYFNLSYVSSTVCHPEHRSSNIFDGDYN